MLGKLAKLQTLKNFRTVSKIITLGEYKLKTTDYKATGRIDDVTYQNDKNLWEHLPRCFATIEYNGNIIRIICGLRKFGNEGEYRSIKSPNEKVHKEYYLNKANGEYCSFSTFKIDNKLFFVFRSKNVSMVLRSDRCDQDLILYDNDPRYMFSKQMAITFLNTYNALEVDKQNNITTKALVDTISMEYCSSEHQHLVDYGKGSRLFAFTLTTYNESINGLTSVLPDVAYDWFKSVDLLTVPYMYVTNMNDTESRNSIRNDVYTELNSEGSVVYQTVLDMYSGVERVWMVYKYKNYKYVFWRAVREKMRARATSSQLVNRLNNLHCTVPNLKELINEAMKFYAYCWNVISEEKWGDLFSSWVTCFDNFHKLNEAEKEDYLKKFNLVDICRQQLQIMPIGVPGSGKSTLLKVLEKLLCDAKRLNQDECNKSAKLYHRNLGKLSKNKEVKVLLMDKCYHNKKVREGSFNSIDVQNLIYIIYYHPDDICPYILKDDDLSNMLNLETFPLDNALGLAKLRIYGRGLSHLNLHPSLELSKILDGFKDSYEMLDEEEIAYAYDMIFIDMTMDITNVVNYVLDCLISKKMIAAEKPSTTIINNTIKSVFNEEHKLGQRNSNMAKIQGWFAQVLDSELGKIYNNDTIKDVLNKCKFNKKNELHCTIMYMDGNNTGDSNSKFNQSLLKPFDNKNTNMLITHIAYDNKIVALRVLTEFVCQNECPHITLAHDPNTQAVYSNTMLKNPSKQ
ncbi:MAG: hypothetical protein Homavirus21_2, partial [Homavirus sp.]